MSLDLLVVDDSLTVRKLVELAFKGADARVAFAVTAEEGLARASSRPPQVILLDYVLPDMKGLEVCRRLAAEPRVTGVPIVLMSAKALDLREQFAAFPAVVDFVAKPFTRDEIVEAITRVAGRGVPAATGAPAAAPPAAPPAPELFSYEQRQEAARLLFKHLKAQLGQIPAWLPHMGDAPAASYFAKKILTPEVMERMLAEFAPFVLDAAMAGAEQAPRLSGQLPGAALADLLRTLETGRWTGTLRLGPPSAATIVHWRAGAIVLATCQDPVEYLREADAPPSASAELLARAEAEQRRCGKPVPASLAEAGALPAADAQRLLAQQGRRLLRRALREPACRLEWSGGEPPVLGGELAQPLPVTQLWLERLRATGSLGEVERRVPSFQTVFERAERFSARVRQLELTPAERKVLALVDGRAAVQELMERTALAARETAHVLRRLAEIGLVRACPGPAPKPKVHVLDPDAEGFRRPLAALLERRPRPAELVALEGAATVLPAAQRDRPALVILNATALGADQAEALARALCAQPEGAGAVVAVFEPEDGARAELAESPHFDAIFVKPVHVSELERLLPA